MSFGSGEPPPAAGGLQLPPQQQQAQQSQPKRKVGLDDFLFLAVLAKGVVGEVMLAEEKRTNGLYAIKVLKKELTIENDEVERSVEDRIELRVATLIWALPPLLAFDPRGVFS